MAGLFSYPRRRTRLAPTQLIALAFLALILLGAVLLALPIASAGGKSCGFLSALFTSTSATCVTGLVLFDTGIQWSLFGQGVILGLIELGGLGFMSAASLVVFLLRRRVGLRQRMLMAQALSMDEMSGIVHLQQWVLWSSLTVQGAGALILFFRFLPQFGWRQAAWWGVFHAVSAFCNAGFDIFGQVLPEGAGMISFNGDWVVCLVLMALIIIGGLGFFVCQEVVTVHSFRKFSVYTKLVLLISLALVLSGAGAICLLEWNNPATLGPMPVWQKILNGFFQSVTTRTAGFASVDQGNLTDAGKAVSMVLMLIGGASGSTAGGMKVVTAAVLVLFVWSRARGRDTVCVFRRTVPEGKVMDATTLACLMLALAMAGAIFISAGSGFSLTDAAYEAVSALATVGLTAGGTPHLNGWCQCLIILYMYFGRVGVLTLSLGFLMGNRAESRFRYAQTNLLIG